MVMVNFSIDNSIVFYLEVNMRFKKINSFHFIIFVHSKTNTTYIRLTEQLTPLCENFFKVLVGVADMFHNGAL